MLKALIFDVDGTLSDTERDGHRPAFNRACAEAGLDWDWGVELYGRLLAVTGGKERMNYYVDHFRPDFIKTPDFSARVADLHAAKTRHYTAMLAQGSIPLRPGVERLLREARTHGVRLAIATTTTPAHVTALLTSTLGAESSGWFEVIAAGDVVPAKKPAPDISHYALEKLGLSPADCLAFEDSENGLLSARGAGLQTVITVNDYTREHDFTGAALVLDHLGEVQQPFTVLQGTAPGPGRVFDLAMARRVHEDTCQQVQAG